MKRVSYHIIHYHNWLSITFTLEKNYLREALAIVQSINHYDETEIVKTRN